MNSQVRALSVTSAPVTASSQHPAGEHKRLVQLDAVVVRSAPIQRRAAEPKRGHDCMPNRLSGGLHHAAMSNDLSVLTGLYDWRWAAGQHLCLSDGYAHPFGDQPCDAAAEQRGDSSESKHILERGQGRNLLPRNSHRHQREERSYDCTGR